MYQIMRGMVQRINILEVQVSDLTKKIGTIRPKTINILMWLNIHSTKSTLSFEDAFARICFDDLDINLLFQYDIWYIFQKNIKEQAYDILCEHIHIFHQKPDTIFIWDLKINKWIKNINEPSIHTQIPNINKNKKNNSIDIDIIFKYCLWMIHKRLSQAIYRWKITNITEDNIKKAENMIEKLFKINLKQSSNIKRIKKIICDTLIEDFTENLIYLDDEEEEEDNEDEDNDEEDNEEEK